MRSSHWKRSLSLSYRAGVVLLAATLAISSQADEDLAGALPQGAHPWNGAAFDHSPEQVRFAIFSDLTGGEREGIFDIAVQQLNLLRPELILNVGDLIEGDGDRANVEGQWDTFDERAGKARAPVFYLGGNHDLVGTMLQDIWDERYGQRYYHFEYRKVLFLVLDTEDNTPERTDEIQRLRDEALKVAASDGWDAFAETPYAKLPENNGGNISEAQSAYFQQALADHPDVMWTFVLMHKAPWLRPDLKAFADIEAALTDRPYTVFHGHKHAYQHQVRHGRDYIRLATTGGVQLSEHGRSMDHVVWVTVDESGADIANLLMSGILDKSGHIPGGGDDECFEAAVCGDLP